MSNIKDIFEKLGIIEEVVDDSEQKQAERPPAVMADRQEAPHNQREAATRDADQLADDEATIEQRAADYLTDNQPTKRPQSDQLAQTEEDATAARIDDEQRDGADSEQSIASEQALPRDQMIDFTAFSTATDDEVDAAQQDVPSDDDLTDALFLTDDSQPADFDADGSAAHDAASLEPSIDELFANQMLDSAADDEAQPERQTQTTEAESAGIEEAEAESPDRDATDQTAQPDDSPLELNKKTDVSISLDNSDILASFIHNNSDLTDEEGDLSAELPDAALAQQAIAVQDHTAAEDDGTPLDSGTKPRIFERAQADRPTETADNFEYEDVEKKLDLMIESYERNKLQSIDDIYQHASLTNELKSSVFMIEVHSKALPENLPLDVKRESVINIMDASDIKVNDMMNDAYKRIDALNKVLENVVQTSEALRTKNNKAIADLEKRILELKKSTKEREDFQEKQNTLIEYEIQRIINIVDFIKDK